MTGTTVCEVCGSWVWGCGGIDVGEGEVAVSDDGGSADVDGNAGIDSKPSEATVDDAMGNVGGPDGVEVVVVPPGTKAGRFNRCSTIGSRYRRRVSRSTPSQKLISAAAACACTLFLKSMKQGRVTW
jgi:hypothetical protein